MEDLTQEASDIQLDDLEKVIGIGSLMRLTVLTGRVLGEWETENTIQNCPHCQLIELVAEILGISSKELGKFEYFCGLRRKDVMVSDMWGRHSRLGGFEKEPFTACVVLRSMIRNVISFIKVEDPGEVRISENTTIDSEGQLEKLKEKLTARKDFQLGCKILKFLEKTISKNFLTETSALDRAAVLKYLSCVLSSLEKITGSGNNVLWTSFNKINCPVAPQYERRQWLYY